MQHTPLVRCPLGSVFFDIIHKLLLGPSTATGGKIIIFSSVCCHKQTVFFKCPAQIPVSEGGASGEEDRFGFWLGLIKQSEKRVVLHTNLPKDFTLVSTAHQKLQRVLMGALKNIKNHSYTSLLYRRHDF